jgi:hypothetical protein
MQKALLDFIVPVASASAFLEQTLSSIRNSINASCKPWLCKILLIDNAIPGIDTQTDLRELAIKYSAEYIRFEERLAIYDNWNRCLTAGTSEWIHFVHDDDMLKDDYVFNLLSKLNGCSLVLSGYEYFNDGNPTLTFSGWKESHSSFTSKEEFLSFLLNRSFHMSALCFKRYGCGSFDTALRYNSDQQFTKKLAFSEGIEGTSVLADKPYVSIRCHPLQDQRQNNIVLVSPKDQQIINSYLIRKGFESQLDPYLLGFLIAKRGTSQAATRIMSSYSYDWPILKSIRLCHGILKGSPSPLKTALNIVLRLLFQKPIWWYKIHKSR